MILLKSFKEVINLMNDENILNYNIDELWKTLHQNYDFIPHNMSNQRAQFIIENAFNDAKAYDFYYDETDLVRFLAICLFCDQPKVLENKWFLENFSYCAKDIEDECNNRLDFIYKHLLPKAQRRINGLSMEPPKV